MSITDAATTLGVPEGTVKSRAFYALRQLRVILDEMGVRR
jgi:RNA polymerase sigma-70 factor (ECF subfamily)